LFEGVLSNLPYAQELDIDFVRKRLLKRVRLLPSLVIRFGVHFVREWDLLVVARWQKADFMNHPSEAIGRSVERIRELFREGLPPSGVGAARKPKDANPIMERSISWFIGDSRLHLQFCIKNSYPPIGSDQQQEPQMGYSGFTHNVGIKVARNGHVKVLAEI
jgi:hypothetical protein